MKMNYLTIGIGGCLVLFLSVMPIRANAFWPFDSDHGKVLGSQSESQVKNFFGQMMKGFKGNRSTEAKEKSAERKNDDFRPRMATKSGEMNYQKRLEQAVKDGKLTQAQANEITTRMAAIETKQQELITLQKSFAEWMKLNNLSLNK